MQKQKLELGTAAHQMPVLRRAAVLTKFAASAISIRAVWFLLGVLVSVTLLVTAINWLDPRHIVERTERMRSLWHVGWPLLATSAILLIEIALTVAVVMQNRRRELAEESLRESEARMALASEAADIGLWRWVLGSGLIWLTPHGRRILGLPSDQTITPTMLESRIHPDDHAMVIAAIDKVVARANDRPQTYEIEYRFLPADGQVRWLRMRGRPRRQLKGNAIELTGTIADITDSRQMKTDMEKQRLTLLHLSRISIMGELSGALAHELKQPLTAIMSNAQAAQRLLDHEPVDFAELRGAIMDIVDDDARAGDVITHLRALLKNDEVHRAPLDLNAIVLAALDLVRNDFTARRLSVIKQMVDGRINLVGDAIQLQQLVLNLFLNAAEAMSIDGEPGGTLLIATDWSEDGQVHLAISDTGTGIREDLQDRLFDPLVTTKAQGLGLGLSISRAIVEAHGGKIWAINNPGRGATFHVLLPTPAEDGS